MTESTRPRAWPWPDHMDAATAAPDSHRVLFENDRVRVVEVSLEPMVREPAHTHRWPSVMVIDGESRIRYFGADGDVEFESPEDQAVDRPEGAPPRTEWMEPEGPHAVENIGSKPYHAIRVELKEQVTG